MEEVWKEGAPLVIGQEFLLLINITITTRQGYNTF